MALRTLLARSARLSFLKEPLSDANYEFRTEKRLEMLKLASVLKGHASAEGTMRYSGRNQTAKASHWKETYGEGLRLGSVGIGTYVGSPETDGLAVFNGIVESVITGGVNVIDTAINYQYMRAERETGAALRLLSELGFGRDQLLLCTKGGYLPHDFDSGESPEQLAERLCKEGVLAVEDVVSGIHCMAPGFLRNQVKKSLQNLGVQTLDLYYLHNPAENQLPQGEASFFKRLGLAFECLEGEVAAGRIRNYGIASWLCFRAPPEEQGVHLSLEKVVGLAEQVGGKGHHFKFVQLPVNMMMTEAFGYTWQTVKEEKVPFLTAAHRLGVNVVTSSPLMQGPLVNVPLPSSVFKVKYNGAKQLQFLRSIPAPALKTTLVGMKRNRHVKTNLEVAQHDRLTPDQWVGFLRQHGTVK